MGIFSRIREAIFSLEPAGRAQARNKATSAPPAAPRPGASQPPARTTPTTSTASAGQGSSAARPTAAGEAGLGAGVVNARWEQPVDVEEVLSGLAAKNPQKLNWKTSIVDLMKLLDIDSSLDNRKELARELGYTGDMGDSAAMNVWLHKRVMQELEKNGGKVPASLVA
jgi:hypothetical protein